MADVENKPAVAASTERVNTEDANNSKDSYRDDRDRNDRNRNSDRGGRGRGRGGRGRGRGGRDFKSDYKHDRKDRDTRKPFKPAKISDDPDEIRTQVEFYFSDSNLNKDAFLFEKTGGPENKPVDIETIANFSLMRRFQPFDAVVKALKDSEVLEVNDKNQIYRKTPLVSLSSSFEENKQLINDRALPLTLYVKGFKPATEIRETQSMVQNYFKPYGVTEVRIRRHGDGQRVFKGSVFVEFPDEESAQKFTTQSHTHEGKPLEVLFKKDFIKREVDNFLGEFDTTAFEGEGEKERAVEDARKILELEYMEPLAAPTAEIKQSEKKESEAQSQDDAHAKLVRENISKVQKKRNDELQARLKAREENKTFNKGANSRGQDSKRKRDRDDDRQSESKNAKVARTEDKKETAGNANGEGKEKKADAVNGKDSQPEETAEAGAETKTDDAQTEELVPAGEEMQTENPEAGPTTAESSA